MKSRNIRWIIILGMTTVAAVILFQVTWLSKTYRLKHQENTQSISLALFSVARQMAEFKGTTFPNENPVVRVSPTYFIVNINDVIEPRLLDHYLHTEFTHRGIDFTFEYAIYDCATDRMVYAGTSADDPLGNIEDNKPSLPQLPEFTYYFGINFPDLPRATVKDLRFWIFSAALLTLAVIFFSYAIFVIFRQRRLSEVQRDFVNAMTHEFKTPISTLRIASDVLREDGIHKDPHRLKQYGAVISEQVRQLQSHVERVLEAARIDRRKLELNRETIHPDDLIRKISVQYELEVQRNKGLFFLDLNCEGAEIQADRNHFSGLLHNLMDNALKFSKKPSIISVQSTIYSSGIRICIADNGPGIPNKERRKIFKKYYRVPEGRVPTHRGFGLGLFYVMKVIKAHHWSIKIENNLEGGSKFIVLIPFKNGGL